MAPTLTILILALTLSGGCRQPAREYELRGIVVAVHADREEITISHEDIPRFMPAMTMPFKVRDVELLRDRVPGDVVRATLVVRNADAHLREIVRTGSAPVPAEAAAVLPDLLEPGDAVPNAVFTDQDGKRVQLSDWRGQAVAVTFVYTRCPVPDFCPLVDRHFRAAQDLVKADPDLLGRVRLLSVSFDPEYDRPPILAAHAGRLGADQAVWTFLTAERAELDRFAPRFGVSIVLGNAGTGEIVHNLATAVIDREGRLSAIVRGNDWRPAELVGELRGALARR